MTKPVLFSRKVIFLVQLLKGYPYPGLLVVSDRNSTQTGLGSELRGQLRVWSGSSKTTVSPSPGLVWSGLGAQVVTGAQADLLQRSVLQVESSSLLIAQATSPGVERGLHDLSEVTVTGEYVTLVI